jgi:hypothetical protein
MLQTKAVEPGTFSLLKKLMTLPSLKNFSLVGGTALALRFGHRSSVDLDLFYHKEFDHTAIEHELQQVFAEDFKYEDGHKRLGIFGFIEEVKVDIVYYPHKPIARNDVFDDIRIYGDADIGAMKIQAILGRGRKKDFWDLHELLQHYSLQQIIGWHKQKYPGQMLAISIPQAITYFDDAEQSETPLSFKGQSWQQIKKDISKIVRDYLR